MKYTVFSRFAVAAALIAAPVGICIVHADGLNGIIYNIARVNSNNFVETRTSPSGDALHIDARVSRGGFFGGEFAPVVTLAFSNQGKKNGEVRLFFNVPGNEKDQTHTITIAGGAALWERSDHIEASAANNQQEPKPPPGQYRATIVIYQD